MFVTETSSAERGEMNKKEKKTIDSEDTISCASSETLIASTG